MAARVERGGQPTLSLGLVIVMIVADLVFLAGVVAPHMTGDDPLVSAWIGVPSLVSVFTLPLIAYGAVLASGRRLLRGESGIARGRQLDVVVVVLAFVGFAAYVSPWGRAAISGLMTALD